MVFFGLFGRWTAGLSPLQILLLAIPWAVFSSATEWFVLVPLLPFWQPLFPLQQPYWIGFLVHMTSAAIYPLFAWIRWPAGKAPPTRDVGFVKVWVASGVALIVLLGLASARLAASGPGREPTAMPTRPICVT
jgi:hypothetical protein